MKYLFRFCFLLPIITLFNSTLSFAQFTPNNGVLDLRTITTAMPILTVAPDARAAGMGDAGVATSPDASSIHWNPGKLGFLQNDMSVSLSYSPWMRNIINDMSLSYLSGYKKINERSTISASMLYFDLGSIQFTNAQGLPIGDFNPKEYAFNVAYGQQLSENLGIGVGAKFIHSNLSSGIQDSKPGNTGAVDVGIYYTKNVNLAEKDFNLSLGGGISNLGAKISYTNANQKDFLPTNLRLGSAFTLNADDFNKFTLALDFNKLLVPSPGADSTQSVPKALFTSFGDARGGFNEELKEITISTGVEYWYNNLFAARVGYFYENPIKGDRHYLSLGVGLRYQKFGIDSAYLIPNERNNPLAGTFRFSLIFNIDDAKSGGAN